MEDEAAKRKCIFSMQTFVVQLASAFAVLIAGIGIDLIKLDTNAAVQTDDTLMGMRFFMIMIPILGLILSLLFFRRRYKLSEIYLENIMTELKQEKESDLLIHRKAQ
jgi:melibiose permease